MKKLKKLNKKSIKIIIGVLICSFIILTIINTNATVKTYTRQQLQYRVVATAKAYLYNNRFTDYEQKAMNGRPTFEDATVTGIKFVNFRENYKSVDSVSRSNKVMLDCSDFVTNVYISTMGFDFTSLYQYNKEKTYNSAQEFKEHFYTTGKGVSTKFLTDTAVAYKDKGKYTVCYKKITRGTNPMTDTTIKDCVNNKMKQGDLVVIRRTKSDNSHSGHTMVYAGDTFEDGRKYIIHSVGTDYAIGAESSSEDELSVRINPLKDYLETQTEVTEFSVIRPIDLICKSDDNCPLDTFDSSSCDSKSNSVCYDSNGYPKDNVANKNISARYLLRRLRTEQYVSKVKLDYASEKNDKEEYISNYNSISKGEVLTFNLYELNKSGAGYCIGAKGSYATKTTKGDCQDAEFTWTTDKAAAIKYIGLKNTSRTRASTNDYGLVIKAKIPDGTTYVSSNNGGVYDSTTKTVTWDTFSDITDAGRTFKLSVTPNLNSTSSQIVFNGFTTEIHGSTTETFQNEKIKVEVSPGFSRNQYIKLREAIDKFKTLYNSGAIVRVSSTTGNYKKALNATTASPVSLSQTEFIKAVYYELGLDLSGLNTTSILNGVFKESTNGEYYSIIATSNLNDTFKAIKVNGTTGGTLLSGNYQSRLHYINSDYLEPGDIIYTKGNDKDTNYRLYLYLGNEIVQNSYLTSSQKPHFAGFFSDDKSVYLTVTASKKVLRDLYKSKVFVVLRPNRLGKTVVLNYNKPNVENEITTQFDLYKNLPTPTKSISLTCMDGTTQLSKTSATLTFGGWYKESTFQTAVSNNKETSSGNHTLYAKWNNKSINLTTPTKTGYKFDGWYTDKALTTKLTTTNNAVQINSDLTIYAKFVKEKYKITFNTNGGSSVSQIEAEYKASVNAPTKPTKSGATFAGWFTDQACTKAFQFPATLTQNITLYAKWVTNEYLITYNLNGGVNNTSNITSYTNQTSFTLLSPTKKGYTFAGWYLDSAFTKKVTKIDSNLSGNITLYAKFTETIYNLNVYKDSTTKIETIKFKYKETVTIKDPNYEGYTFDGWYDQSLKNKIDLTNLDAKNIDIYAKLIPVDYRISVNENGNQYNIKYNIETPTFTLTHDYTNEGYIFNGWQDSEGNVQDTVTISKGTTGNKSYTARYNQINYNVVFDLNGAEGTIGPIVVKYEDTIDVEPTNITYEGYSFIGWSTNRNAQKEFEDNPEGLSKLTTENNSTVTLYAIWDKNEKTVKLNLENATVDATEKNITNEDYEFKITPNDGYEFNKVTCTNNQYPTFEGNSLSFDTITNDTTCNVKYTLKKYSINYDLNNGYFDEDKVVIKSYDVNTDTFTLEKPLRTNYEFIGWSDSSNEKSLDYQITKGTSEDINVKANWQPKVYKITLNSNNGSGFTDTIDYTYGTKITLPRNSYTKENYIFLGWNTDSNATTALYKDNTDIYNSIENDTVLYAIWEKNSKILTINVQNGTVENTTVEIPKYDDYTFDVTPITGYGNATISCTNNQHMSRNNNKFTLYGITNDTTCTIINNLIDYKITYVLNGGTASNKTAYNYSDEFTVNNPTKKGNEFIGWTTEDDDTLELNKTIKNQTGDIVLIANYSPNTMTISYQVNNSERGSIQGTQEEVEFDKSPNANVTIIPNEGYKVIKITADKDVRLDNNKTIYANQKIEKNELNRIVVDEDLTITYSLGLESIKVTYKSDEFGKILGETTENVAEEDNPIGLNIQPNRGYSISHLTANKDVYVGDNLVTKDSIINLEDYNKIIITEELELTIYNKINNYLIKFFNDTNSSVKTSENTLTIKDIIEKPEYTVNNNYKLKYWYSDEDLYLKDDTVINARERIDEDKLGDIVIDHDINLYLRTTKENKIVSFKIKNNDSTYNNLNVNIDQKEIDYSMFNSDTVFFADKDFYLTDNTLIKAQEEFGLIQLKQADFDEDIEITVINKKPMVIENVPNTMVTITKIIVILGSIVILIGAAIVAYNLLPINKKIRIN